jgi:hypothetical protein
MLRSLPQYLRTAKEREETALTDLSLTVLPNLFRGNGDGRVERRFQIENLEFQFEDRRGNVSI